MALPLTCQVFLPVAAVKPTKALPWFRCRVSSRFSGTTRQGSCHVKASLGQGERGGGTEGWNYVGRKVAYGNRGARKSSVMFDASRRGKKGLKCSRDKHEGTYGSGEGVEETAS